MPKLWNETVDAHRREVRDAILDATEALAAEHGVLSVTMSQIAEATGIGRATLYKYFPDVEAILLAWHEREITGYLERLAQAHAAAGDPAQRLRAVASTYARLVHEAHGQHSTDLAAVLHRGHLGHPAHPAQHGGPLSEPHRRLHQMLRDLVADAAADGTVRDDVPPEELATYCVHALGAARTLPSQRAVDRLVTVTLDGLRRRR